MSYLYSVRWGVLDRSTAAIAATVTATVPLLGYFATLPMSEGLFMLALTAALWQTERLAATEGGGWGRRVACGLALTACALLRTAGLVIVIVMLVWLSRRRALKPSVIVMAILPVLGWFAWTASAAVASDLRTAYYYELLRVVDVTGARSVRVSGGRERAVGLERSRNRHRSRALDVRRPTGRHLRRHRRGACCRLVRGRTGAHRARSCRIRRATVRLALAQPALPGPRRALADHGGLRVA